ncbi:MAG: sensor histidine kinase [Planctomycetota bacterium]
MGILAAGLAHELNNPIGSILLAAQNAKASPSSVDACLDTILRNARRCAAVVRSVLQVSQTDPTERAAVDLNQVIGEVATALAGDLEERHASIELNLGREIPPIMGNSLELGQVVGNLVRNAVQAAPSGVRVRVSTAVKKNAVALVVADDGRGMSGATQDRMFEPFFTTRQDEGGTGLGLSLVRAIVHSHGGRVDVASEPGEGTRIEVVVPQQPERSDGSDGSVGAESGDEA